MAKFAQYYLKYNLEHIFSAEHKDRRQQIFGAFFAQNDSIEFAMGEGEDRKVYKHQVYHLMQNKDIIVMRFANDRKKTVEQDFVERDVKHEPSCFVIIDNRTNCRRIAIQKNKAFHSTTSVAGILTHCINERMQSRHFIGIELHPQYYPKDFYKAWRMHQHHTARLRFNISEGELPPGFDEKEYEDEGIMSFALKVNEEEARKKYRTVVELNPAENGKSLYVDEESTYIRNLVKFSAFTGSRIEIVTLDGAKFTCYIDEEAESETIVCNELEARVLEALFDGETDDRAGAELKVLAFVNGMKYIVDKDEKKESVA